MVQGSSRIQSSGAWKFTKHFPRVLVWVLLQTWAFNAGPKTRLPSRFGLLFLQTLQIWVSAFAIGLIDASFGTGLFEDSGTCGSKFYKAFPCRVLIWVSAVSRLRALMHDPINGVV